jgi:dGTPase
LAGYKAIYGLLDNFAILLECSPQRFQAALRYENKDGLGEPIVIENKYLKLFPARYKKAYEYAVNHNSASGEPEERSLVEWNARAHLIVDFISGMTDDFAMTFYRTLAGMKL